MTTTFIDMLKLSDLRTASCGVLRKASNTRPTIQILEENGIRAVDDDDQNIYTFRWQLIHTFLEAWREETADSTQPITRAEETLRLLKIQGKPNPFLKEINGNFVMPFTHGGMVEESDGVDKRYEIAGLNEIYLDYAGGFPQTHPIHSRLAAMTAGQQVNLVIENEKLEIRDHSGECVGRFSKEGVGRWRERLGNILEVRVVGMLQRNRDDPDAPFHKRIKADKWEIPVLEIISTAQPV